MRELLRQYGVYLIGALLLHALFAGVLALTMVSITRQPPPVQLAIQAVVVDQSLLERTASRPPAPDPDAQRQRAEAQQREQAAEQERRQREEEARRVAEQRSEQERLLQQRRQEEEQQRRQAEERQLRERQEAQRQREVQEQQRQAEEAERKRVAEIQRRQQEEAQRRKLAEENRAQQAREAELRRQLEEEEGRMQAASAGLLSEYVSMIEQRIVRNWNRPPSARTGLECEVHVAQAPGGTVLTVRIGRCNGDAAVKQSIEAAVMRASPLPPPPDPRLFERNLVLVFKPLD